MAINDPKSQQNQMIRQPNQPQQQKRGSGFTNINRVLGANQNNRLGTSISQGVLGQAEQARGNIREASNKFREEAGSNRLDTEGNRVARQNILNKVTQETDAPPVLGEDEQKQFENFRTGTYKGPQQLGNEGEIRSQAENAQQLGKLTQTSGGRQGLLQRFAGGAGYGLGQQKVDNLLLSGAPGGLNAIRRYTQGLGEEQNRAINEARNVGSEYANRAKAFNMETDEAVKGAYNPINQQIEGKLAAAKTAEDQRSKQYWDVKNLLDPTRRAANESTKGLSETEASKQAVNKLKESGLLKEEDLDKIMNNVQLTKVRSDLIRGGGAESGNFETFLGDQGIRRSGMRFFDTNKGNREVDPFNDFDFYKTAQGSFNAKRKGEAINNDMANFNAQELLSALNQKEAVGLNKEGLTSSVDAARLNALNKLGGNINPQVQAGTGYQAGSTSFDLNKYLESIKGKYEAGKDRYKVI